MELQLYDLWNDKKKELQALKNDVMVYEREIWLASLGENIGVEINGKNDTKRLFRKIGKLSVGQFQEIKKSAQALLEPQSPRWL